MYRTTCMYLRWCTSTHWSLEKCFKYHQVETWIVCFLIVGNVAANLETVHCSLCPITKLIWKTQQETEPIYVKANCVTYRWCLIDVYKKKHKVTTLFSTAAADRICCERDGCYDDLTLLKWCFYSVWNHLKQVKGKTAKAFTCTAQTNISFTYIKMMLLFSAEPNEPSQGQICASF